MTEFYNMPWSYVIKALETNQYRGLSKEEVQKRREEKTNVVNVSKVHSPIFLFLKELWNIWVIYSLLGLSVSIYLGEILLSIIIALLFLSTLILNIKLRYKNEKALKTLQNLNNTVATVLREGVISNVNCKELVLGDIVLLDKNFIIPADLRIIESENLKIKETIVTGEKYLVEKYETKIEEHDIPLADMKNIAFKASQVIDGSGVGVIIALGEDTQIGKIVEVLDYDRKAKYILDNKINKNINFMSLIFSFLILSISAINLFITNDIKGSLEIFTYLFLCFAPPSFLIFFSIYLFWVNNFLQRKGIFIKNISIFELIKNLDVIFLNKVGAVTESQMTMEKLYTDGKVYSDGDEENINNIHLERFLHVALLCNNGSYDFEKDKGKGDLIDQALIKYSSKFSLFKTNLDKSQRRIFEIPYDSDKRIQTSLNKVDDNFRANVKGAVDMVLERCTYVMKNGIEKELTEEEINEIKAGDIAISSTGLKTIGFAYRSFNYEPSTSENIESNLVFLGIAGFENPIKEGANNCIADIKSHGVKTVLVTDDNKLTAKAWGEDINLIRTTEEIWSGIEMEYMDQEELERNINKIKIFSRINSRDKFKIVEKWTDKSLNVLCSGENMTELPAMNKANVAMTVGNSGKMVRNLSDIYIEEDSLHNLSELINLSPKFLIQIKKSLEYIFSCSFVLLFLLVLDKVLTKEFSLNSYSILMLSAIVMPLGALNILLREDNEEIRLKDIEILSLNLFNCMFKGAFVSLMIYGLYRLNIKFFNEDSGYVLYFSAISYFIIRAFAGALKSSLDKSITRTLFFGESITLFLIIFQFTNMFETKVPVKNVLVIIVFSILYYFVARKNSIDQI
ncbi:cation-transporting P-type ATPase [Clostridium amazonitimonense]|uniref:P-type ATPase n=1 Tax=Clostridium amazonitimonense TaxID=1499689 RepID=UPI000509AD4F|nr:cation-transporting P-type ATPase [Clostridium amazonitimonense]